VPRPVRDRVAAPARSSEAFRVGSQLASFLLVSALVIVLPGQDTALTIRNTLVGGRRAGRLTAAGVSSGQAAWAVATAAGVAAVLQASEPAFLALRVAGAAYLVFLGAQSLRTALRHRQLMTPEAVAGPRRTVGSRAAFRQGLLSNLGNPKMAVFFISLLPQFTQNGHGAFLSSLLLGGMFSALTFLWLTGYAVAVARAGEVLRRPSVSRAVEGITGAALVGVGVRVAAEAS
jgi:threonine/homoserine/homoserine lactone efflux protein